MTEGSHDPPRQQFTAEFKQEAGRLVQRTGQRCAQIACDLGVPAHGWEIARQERDLVKKALS